MLRKNLRFFLLLSLVILITTACTLPGKKAILPSSNQSPSTTTNTSTSSSAVASTNELRKFNSYDELAKFLADNNNPEGAYSSAASFGASASRSMSAALATTAPGVALRSGSLESTADSGSTTSDTASASDNALPNNSLDYSLTNNQVSGVDEPDIIKTDGTYIYALVRNDLFIIKAVPGEAAEVLSKITFKSRPQDILISGTALAVFGSDDQIYTEAVYKTFRRQNPYTFLKVFDLNNPSDPRQVRDLRFEGSYYDARLVGDYVYFLTNSYSSYMATEPLVPRVLDNGQVLATKCDSGQRCFAPDVFYFDIPYDSYNFTSITAINLKNSGEAISGQVYVLSSGQNLYVSQNNIYITYTQYLSEYDLEQQVKREVIFPKLDSGDQNKITQIESAPNFILNNNEKKIKVAQIIDHYIYSLSDNEQSALNTDIDTALKQKLAEKAKDMEKTVISKISINGSSLQYRAKGEVNGQILNQFSMDESGNYFRIATTRNKQWSQLSGQSSDSYSNVFVLDNDLKVVGSLENLATSEQIYAARFIGNRVYLVTYKQTDPLYVIGLADPTKPTVLGALKVPGFSNYLHPVDADGNKLIGLGHDTDETTGQVKGLKLSLYDFSDLSKPQELSSYLLGDATSDSVALYDHKAFLYSGAKNLLVIPAVWQEKGKLAFAGSLVFSINDNQLSLKGKIDHSAGGHFTQADYWQGINYYDNTVKRSLYIGDDLYTFSNKFLKVNSLADLKEKKSLELTMGGDDYIITPLPAGSPETGTSSSGAETSSSGAGVSASGDLPNPVNSEVPLAPETGSANQATSTEPTSTLTPITPVGSSSAPAASGAGLDTAASTSSPAVGQ